MSFGERFHSGDYSSNYNDPNRRQSSSSTFGGFDNNDEHNHDNINNKNNNTNYNNNWDDGDTKTDNKNRQLTAGEAGAKFAALKKDFLFHEKRMQLLLSSSVIEGLSAAINEKLTTRDECAQDCQKTLKQLSDVSQMPTLTGRWNESVVASVLQLTIPIRDVVGSQLYESTETGEVEDLKDYIKQLAQQAEEHTEFQQQQQGQKSTKKKDNTTIDSETKNNNNNNKNNNNSTKSSSSPSSSSSLLLQNLLLSINTSALSSRDVRRMKDAVFSKLQVIAELSHLSDALQKSGFQLAQVRSDVCRLQEQEDTANNDGEVAVSESLVEQRVASLEKIIDIIFFRLHTVDATIDTNVTKRHSNLQALQHTTVALEGIKREKSDVVQSCADDIRRIDRSLQLQQIKEQTDSRGAELVAESQEKLSVIEEKRVALSDRLHALGAEFVETERALAKLGVERAIAIDRHLDLVEQSRHAAADFAEMSRFAAAHRKNLEITREKSNEGLEAVSLLERMLLQETDYMQYNFRASATRLQNVRENVATELKSALRDYEIAIGEMLRRKQEMVLRLEEQIHVAECEAELRKDLFDPTAKKFVEKQRKFEEQRNAIVNEMCVLSEKLGQQVSSIKNRLGEEFVNDSVGMLSQHDPRKQQQQEQQQQQQQSETKKMVSDLREKVAKEMTLLQLEQARHDEYARAALTNTQRHLRDVVDGVTRISEDDELHRRNIRKHERLLDRRQELLDSRNAHVNAIEERKELAALAQTVESTAGLHHEAVMEEFRRREDIDDLKRRGLLSAPATTTTTATPQPKGSARGGNGNGGGDDDEDDENVGDASASSANVYSRRRHSVASASVPSSNARALSIREEIRRAKARASCSLRCQQLRLDDQNNNVEELHDVESRRRRAGLGGAATVANANPNSQLRGYEIPTRQQQQRERQGRGSALDQVSLIVHGDDDDDDIDDRDRSSLLAQGSGVRVARNRGHPRVIGSANKFSQD